MDYQHHNSVQDKVIVKFKEVHGDTYNYSLVQYIKNNIKVKIICQKHGVFEQTPDAHKTGSGCKKCWKDKYSQESAINFLKNKFHIRYFFLKYRNLHLKQKIN